MTTPSRSKFNLRFLQLLCELLGVLAIASAGFMIWIPLGFLVIGAWLLLVGNAKVGT